MDGLLATIVQETVVDITEFEKSYKGSEEEAETLRSAYVDCEGDMERILEEVSMCVCVCLVNQTGTGVTTIFSTLNYEKPL